MTKTERLLSKLYWLTHPIYRGLTIFICASIIFPLIGILLAYNPLILLVLTILSGIILERVTRR